MTELRATTVIDAPLAVLSRVLRRADVWTRTARTMDARAEIEPAAAQPTELLTDGRLISVLPAATRRTDRWLPPRRLLLRVGLDDQEFPTLDMVAGPLTRCRVRITAVPADGGVQVTVECDVAATSPTADRVARRGAVRAARVLLGITVLALREEKVVVAAAILDSDTVLAAQRTAPPALAGKWELPGGKVRPGETDQTALRRDIAEELGVTITVGERIGEALELENGAILRCYGAAVTSGGLQLSEHREAKWVGAGELGQLDWLAADRLLLPALETVLRETT